MRVQLVVCTRHEKFRHYLRKYIVPITQAQQLRGVDPKNVELIFVEDWYRLKDSLEIDEIAKMMESRGAKITRIGEL